MDRCCTGCFIIAGCAGVRLCESIYSCLRLILCAGCSIIAEHSLTLIRYTLTRLSLFISVYIYHGKIAQNVRFTQEKFTKSPTCLPTIVALAIYVSEVSSGFHQLLYI